MVNKVILVGNVGIDPEVRTLEGGAKVARIRLATTERLYDRASNETKEHTEWHTITLWRGLADVVDRYVRKGTQLYIEGRLRTREWMDKDNNKRYTTEILADTMNLLGRRSDNPASDAAPAYGAAGGYGQHPPGDRLQATARRAATGSRPRRSSRRLNRPRSLHRRPTIRTICRSDRPPLASFGKTDPCDRIFFLPGGMRGCPLRRCSIWSGWNRCSAGSVPRLCLSVPYMDLFAGVGRLLRNPRIVRIFVVRCAGRFPAAGFRAGAGRMSQRFEHMKKIVNPWRGMEGYRCFGCDPHSERGLRMEFYEEGEQIVCRWHPRPEFQGWVNTLHGGIQATLADEISSWVVFRKFQTSGVTSRMEVRYHKPIHTTDEYIDLKASVVSRRRNLVEIAVRIFDCRGELCTEAVCLYFLFPKERAQREFHFCDCGVEECGDGAAAPESADR